jgi:carbon-monoxide dehydrogenase small subunit
LTRISVEVDGATYSDDVEPRMLLVHYLRERLGKTGTVVGCDTSNCGACTVHLDGRSVKSCNVLAVQVDGQQVTTVEGLAAQDGELHPMQKAFHECHALQCGYCTPGMIMQSIDLLNENPKPSESEIRSGLEGNLCRCTGYHNIVRAVQTASGQQPTAGSVQGSAS